MIPDLRKHLALTALAALMLMGCTESAPPLTALAPPLTYCRAALTASSARLIASDGLERLTSAISCKPADFSAFSKRLEGTRGST